VLAAEHAPRVRFQFLERRHSLAQIVEGGTPVLRDMIFDVEIGLAHEVLYKLTTCPELPGGGCRRFHIPTYVSTVRHLPPGKLTGPEKQSRAQIDAVEVAYAALDAASRGDDVLAAEIVSIGVFEASQRRRDALLARNVTHNHR
jgi:hypothetical protein